MSTDAREVFWDAPAAREPRWARRNRAARERIAAILDAGPARDSVSFNDQFSSQAPLAVLWVSSDQLLAEWVGYLLGAGGDLTVAPTTGRAYGSWRVVRSEVLVAGWRVSLQARVPAESFDSQLDERFGPVVQPNRCQRCGDMTVSYGDRICHATTAPDHDPVLDAAFGGAT